MPAAAVVRTREARFRGFPEQEAGAPAGRAIAAFLRGAPARVA